MNVVELLEAELQRAGPSLNAAQMARLRSGERPLTSQSVSRELEFREEMDHAAAQFAATLSWPHMDSIPAVLALARMTEAYHFARVLLRSPLKPKKIAVEAWLKWLLVDYWAESGWAMSHQRWVRIDEA